MKKLIFSLFALMFIGMISINVNATKWQNNIDEAKDWAALVERNKVDNTQEKIVSTFIKSEATNNSNPYGYLSTKEQRRMKIRACVDARFGNGDIYDCINKVDNNQISDDLANAYMKKVKSDRHKAKVRQARINEEIKAQEAIDAENAAGGTPTGLTGTYDSSTMYLNWNVVNGADLYNVYEAYDIDETTSKTMDGTLVGNTITNSYDYNWGGVSGWYTFSVTSLFGSSESPHSEKVSI